MADLVYTRVSTDEQSTQRQTYLLAEAGLTEGAEGMRLFSDRRPRRRSRRWSAPASGT
jgi:putative DNA-invertase from lambdoid prophage Rac